MEGEAVVVNVAVGGLSAVVFRGACKVPGGQRRGPMCWNMLLGPESTGSLNGLMSEVLGV